MTYFSRTNSYNKTYGNYIRSSNFNGIFSFSWNRTWLHLSWNQVVIKESGVEIMIVLKILLIILSVIFESIWLTMIISIGVYTGLKNYFDRISK